MANTPIPSLPIATSLDGTEQLELVQPAGSGGTSKRATSAQIAGLAAGLPSTSLPALSVFGNPTLIGQVGTAIIGTAGQVLVVNDAGSAVNFGRVNLANTASVTGVLTANFGGTGVNSYATGDLIYANTSTAFGKLADVATGNVLLSGGVGVAPFWGPASLTALVTGTLSIALGGTSTTGFVVNTVVIGNGTSGLKSSNVGTSGYLLIGQGTASAPLWGAMAGDATFDNAGTLTIANSAVVFGKIQTMTGLSVFGVTGTARATGTSIIGTAGQVLVVNDAGTSLGFGKLNLTSAATGTLPVTLGGTSTTGFVANGVVLGNGTAGLLATAVGTNGQIFLGLANAAPSFNTMSGDATIATTGVLTIGSNAVTFDKFQTMTGLSVLGVTGTARATGTSIIGTASQVLIVNDGGTSLGFGRVNLTAAAVTGTLAVNLGGSGTTGFVANGVVVGNGTAGLLATAVGTNGQILTGQSGNPPQWATVSGDATIDNAGALTIGANKVTFAKFQTMTGLSVFGVTGTATANGTAIIGTASQVLIVNDGGTSLGFGRVNLTAAAVTGTLSVNLGGTSTTGFVANGILIGNGTAGIQATAAGSSASVLLGQGAANPTFNTMGGDATISSTGTLTLANTAVTTGTYGNGSTLAATFVVDSKGRITSATNVAPTIPTAQTFTSGSGTYPPAAGAVWLDILIIGGGGGGAGGGSSAGAGIAGGNTTFSTHVAGGGAGAAVGFTVGGTGGTASGSPTYSQSGGIGGTSHTGTLLEDFGSLGGESFFPGVGTPGFTAAANASKSNTGAGGSGGGGSNTVATGAGGGGGAWARILKGSPNATYSYSVGTNGTAGAGGSFGTAGGTGSTGYIIVTEYYLA